MKHPPGKEDKIDVVFLFWFDFDKAAMPQFNFTSTSLIIFPY